MPLELLAIERKSINDAMTSGKKNKLSFMKKILASVGMIAVGAASVQAQGGYAPGLTSQEMQKPWSVSASLRGFYDDNYLTLPSSYPTPGGAQAYGHPLSSYGTDISPSAAVHHSTDDTMESASYIYDLKYFGDHSYTEQSHQVNGRFEHQFSENYRMSVSDSFVVAQEPTLIDPSIISTPLLTEGNNVHNTGIVDFTAVLTKLFDLHLAYANNLYAYRQVEGDLPQPPPYASRSAALDRMEQLATVDLRWKVEPDTTGVLGYQYGHTGYTSPEYIIYPSTVAPVTPGFKSNSRNSDQDFVYVGGDHSFTQELNGSVRLGAEYLDYYNIPNTATSSPTTRLSPYVDVSLTDQYQAKCSAQVGVKHVHSSTDVVGTGTSMSPVVDSDTTAAYISVNHAVSDKLTASLLGQAQFSTFNGGGAGYNGQGEAFFIAGLNVGYKVNEWFLTEAGYNYSKLNSDLPDRGYTRNYVYLGIRATY